jgi:hypothetical protein
VVVCRQEVKSVSDFVRRPKPGVNVDDEGDPLKPEGGRADLLGG